MEKPGHISVPGNVRTLTLKGGAAHRMKGGHMCDCLKRKNKFRTELWKYADDTMEVFRKSTAYFRTEAEARAEFERKKKSGYTFGIMYALDDDGIWQIIDRFDVGPWKKISGKVKWNMKSVSKS